MSNQRIDQMFKQKLGDGTMPVPAGLWNNIEPFLPEAKRRTRWGLIWLIGTGILLAGLTYWLVSNNSQTENISITEAVAADRSSTIANQSVKTSNNESQNTVNAVLADEAETSEEISSGTISLQSNQLSGTQKALLASSRNSKASETSGSHIIHNALTESYEQNTLLVKEGSLENAMTDLNLDHNTTTSLLTSPVLLVQDFNRRRLPDPAKDCYSFGSKGNRGNLLVFAEAYMGPGIATKKMTSREEDVSTYIAQRDSTESSRLSWHAGLRAGFLHRSGITLRVGAHYTQVNELFDYIDGTFVGSITRIDTFYDANGMIDDIDTVLVPVSGQRIKTTHNRYHTVDIPVLLGYQVSQGHWTYGLQAGPVFNLAFIKKGDILGSDGEPHSISTDADDEYPAYKDKLGLSIYAAAHIGHRIGYRTTLYAEPYVQHRMKTLTLDTYPIDQRQTNIGLSIGLRVVLQ